MPSTIDEVEELDDLYAISKSFGLSTKGCKGVDDLKAKLCEYLQGLEGSSKRKVGNTFQVLSEACKLDKEKREKLCGLYKETAEFFEQLDKDNVIVKALEESLVDFKTTLQKNIKDIKPKDQYVVLVAGETSAGKSSIINLILGKDLLPYSVLSTTSTICELKYGEKPAIRVHFKEDSNEPIYRELGNSSGSFKEELEEFVNIKTEREKGSPYQKIELFWPHPLFKEGVMIVDSPGVGESKAMNEFVLNYLGDAFCFIYVIKSSNAGGVQEDRLGMLLSEAKILKKTASMDDRLFTSCALFISNMWDQIPADNVEAVKKTQIEKLTEKFGDLDQESQIVYLSCQKAQLAQEYGVITEDFDQLLSGISNLVVSYMQSSLQIYYRWLEDLLSRAFDQVRIFLNSTTMSRKDTEKRMKRVMSRMDDLESSQDRLFAELGEYQAQVIKGIINDLAAYFKSEDTIKRFCTWSLFQLPEAKATWEETKSEVLKCISERARQFVQQWEDEEHRFAKTQVALMKYCTEKYDIMEEEIRSVEEDALFGKLEQECPTYDPSKAPESRSRLRKKHLQGSAPVWLRQGLTSVVLSAPFLRSISQKFKKNIQYRKKLDKFKFDRASYMEKKSKKCLRLIANEHSLLPFISEQLEDAVQFLVEIRAKIPRLREGDKKLYLQLLTESRSKFEVQGIYEPVSSRLDTLRRGITVFYVSFMETSDFSSEELQWKQDDKSIVGRGTFSTVYSGVLLRKEKPEIEVALKVYNSPLRSNNIWHFIEEERLLRLFHHPNIVKFFGTHLQQSSRLTKVMIVLELCKCSLKTHIMTHPESAPAHSEDQTLRTNVFLWAQQILDALKYVHEKGFVHRDLKLDNLLLTDDNKVKLTDVGIAKHEKEISGTFCGTLLYLAPEVMAGEMYDSKADMYSFGLILWEMWYAETVFQTEIFSHSQFKLPNDIREGLRPSHIDGTHEPWGLWQLVMMSCWDSKPGNRPTAEESWNALDKFHQCQEETTPSGLLKHDPLPEAPQSQSTAANRPIPGNRSTAKESWNALDKLHQCQEETTPSGLLKHDPLPEAPQSQSTAANRSTPLKPKPAPKPRPKPPITAPKPKRTSVSFSSKNGDENVHFQ